MSEVTLAGGSAGGGALEIVHIPAAQPTPGLSPSHLVVDGSAYALFPLPAVLHSAAGGTAVIDALGRLGAVEVRLNREAGEWHIEAPSTGVPPVRVATGDRLKLRANGQDVELIIVAERRPGAV